MRIHANSHIPPVVYHLCDISCLTHHNWGLFEYLLQLMRRLLIHADQPKDTLKTLCLSIALRMRCQLTQHAYFLLFQRSDGQLELVFSPCRGTLNCCAEK